jgi:biopolymer transport protein ExbB
MSSISESPRAELAPRKSAGVPATLLALLLLCLSAFPASPTHAQEPDAVVADEQSETVVESTATVEEEEMPEEIIIPGVPILERFTQGGWIMFVLLGLSFVMGTFTVERLTHLKRKNIAPDGLSRRAQDAWRKGDMDGVVKAADEQPSVLASAIRLLVKHRHIPGSDVSNIAGDEVSRLMRRHLQRAYPLAVVATLAPLLGLLGTITGMIEAFEVVAIAGSLGDASMLASGIAKALVTTAFGLIVAIPALGLYHHFRSRTHELSLGVEEEVDELISDWFHPHPEEPQLAKA